MAMPQTQQQSQVNENQESRNPVFNVTPSEIVPSPYPHVAKQPLIQPELYRRLKAEFPSNKFFEGRAKVIGSRTGRDFFKGDPEFDQFIKSSPAWNEFYNYISSPDFIKFSMACFGPYLKKFNCSVDPAKARLVDYTENRFSLWWRSKKAIYFGSRAGNPNDLFTRFDIEQGAEGYEKPVHCDWPSRLLSVVVYFCDADEIGMDGGDLRIHDTVDDRPYSECKRKPKPEDVKVVKTMRPRENSGAIFLCSNNSYHSVTAVNSVKDYRRFIYLNVSSKAENIW